MNLHIPSAQANFLKRRISSLLNDLGNGADAVADTLRSEKIRGVRRNCIGCPIYNYLKKFLPDYIFQVYLQQVQYGPENDFIFSPESVSKFIEAFDNGAYNDLCS